MSKLQSEKRVNLTVKAADCMTEIFLVDSGFQRVDSGIGLLETQVVPGIYKARFRAGQTQIDKIIAVEAGSENKTFTGPAVEFITPVPLPQTSGNRRIHQDTAQKFSHTISLKKGNGSQFYLFIRGLSEEASRPWLGVSLHNINGNLLARAEQGKCDAENGFCALNIEVDPGTYRLRVEEEPGEIYEMFVVTAAGWQTQVFALAEDAWLPGIAACRAALPTASVFMVREGTGFDPSSPVVRQIELIRLGLLNGRKILTKNAAENLLQERDLNPMLVLFATHLLMRQTSVDYPLVSRILESLQRPLFFHSDIQAVHLCQEVGKFENPPDFSSPPMLTSSWQLILQADRQGKAVIPQGSLSEQIAEGVLNTSLWLIHRLAGPDR